MVEDASPGKKTFRFRLSLIRSAASAAGISLLLLSGIVGLRFTGSRLSGSADSSVASLAQMTGALTLVQSFRGDPYRTVPALWTERLGVKPATDLWQRYGRSIWWQAWSQDGDAYLILPHSDLPADIKGLQRKRVGSLEVLASDPLHRRQLTQRLQDSHSSRIDVHPASLFASCLQTLVEAPGVLWNADALATISGTLAPLLQQGREGCVRLQLESDRLLWEGVIGYRPLSSALQRTTTVSSGSIDSGSEQRFSDQRPSNLTLLQIDGRRLNLILGTLLSRQIIQVPLEEHYGIDGSMRSRIAGLPFSLRLQSRASGAYKAGLQIQLPLSGQRQQWLSILEAVSDRLQARGFQQLQAETTKAQSKSSLSTLWRRRDGDDITTVGGWQVINDVRINGQKTAVLSIGFGIEPDPQSFYDVNANQTSSMLRISADPKQLTQLELLGGLWPKPVQQAIALTMSVNPLDGSGTRDSWWRISGGLTLKPAS